MAHKHTTWIACVNSHLTCIISLRMYLGWSLCTLSLLACQVSYHRRLGSLCLCAIFQASINCLLILHWLSGPRHVSDCVINTYVQNWHACGTVAIFTTFEADLYWRCRFQLSVQLQQSSEYWSDKVRSLSGLDRGRGITTASPRPRWWLAAGTWCDPVLTSLPVLLWKRASRVS